MGFGNGSLLDRKFTDRFTRMLPGDTLGDIRPRQVMGSAWAAVAPAPVREPRLLLWSDRLAAELGIADTPQDDPRVAAVLAGNEQLPGMRTWSAAYAGHQCGHWAGQLGDGRAITLGELVDHTGQHQELQLKGAGRTPFSRGADGRAVLRSSLREFLCSEAMHGLGIPTTRVLSLVLTGEQVIRDMFYDGNLAAEPGAIVCRVAPSFLRFGNFQLAAARGDLPLLEQLLDFCIEHYFPDIDAADEIERCASWFNEVCRRTALLLTHWMHVGFVHGVMNTDNMSVLGLTIDYGPYGWLEPFEPGWTPNTTDSEGRRYCYGRQPQIAQWNLARLAETLLALDVAENLLQDGLSLYAGTFSARYRSLQARRLGLPEDEATIALASKLPAMLEQGEVDYALFHRLLSRLPAGSSSAEELLAPLAPAFHRPEPPAALVHWLLAWSSLAARSGEDDEERRTNMDALNPKYVPRNWLVQVAIEAAETGDLEPARRLLRVLQRPFDEQPGEDGLAARRPDWARNRPGCSALSCSS